MFHHARSRQQAAEATTRFVRDKVFSFAHRQVTDTLIHGATARMHSASQLLLQELIQSLFPTAADAKALAVKPFM